MKKILLIILLSYPAANAYAQKKTINITTELNKLGNIGELPRYWEDTKVVQVSSYDTTGLNNDGFSGKYSFIRKTADSALVIFEAKGNGVINRIWTPTPTDDTLDFYFGGQDTPSYSVRFSDLFTGEVYPFVTPLTGNEIGGYFCYFPIPFKNGCKIIFRGDKLEFYQIQHRSYPRNYRVENFSQQQANAARPEINALVRKWESVGEFANNSAISTDTLLAPGQTISLAELDGGGRIVGIELQPAEAFTGLNKQIDLKVTWDGEERPAIYVPVADFFGYAFGKTSMQSLLLGSEENTNYCYFPMPFDDSAIIELVYRNPSSLPGEAIRIRSKVFFSEEERDQKKEGKFYAYWNRNKDAPLGKPHLFLEGKGKGHYVGTILQCQGLNPGMTTFFEGDDITTIDGEMRIHGTGSEDYFNGGWYALLDRWDRKMSLPLHGSLDYSLPYARTGGYRLFIADKMPFEKEIRHTIEHGPEHNNVPVDYTSVAFYYSEEPVARQEDKPANALTAVYIPGTFMVYPQLMRYSFAGAFTIEGNSLQSSNGGQVRIDLSELPKGHYKLYADMEKAPDGAEIRVWQRQTPVSKTISFYAREKIVKPKEYLCDIDINDFKETITLHFKKDETKSKIHINRLILIRNE